MLELLREEGAFREGRPRFHLSMPLFEGENHPDTHQVVRPPQASMSMDPEFIVQQVRTLAAMGRDLAGPASRGRPIRRTARRAPTGIKSR